MATQLERRTSTQQAVVDAAIELYIERSGFTASLDDVAERAGVAKSTLLYHFQSRVGLLQAVAARLYDELVERLGPIDKYEDAAEFIAAFLKESRNPGTRLLHQVGEELRFASQEAGMSPGIILMMDVLKELGLEERPLVTAAATLMLARQVSFGQVDEATIDQWVDELFVVERSRRRRT